MVADPPLVASKNHNFAIIVAMTVNSWVWVSVPSLLVQVKYQVTNLSDICFYQPTTTTSEQTVTPVAVKPFPRNVMPTQVKPTIGCPAIESLVIFF